MGLYEPHHLEFYAIGTPGDGTPTSLRSYYQAGDAEVIEWIQEVRILSAE